MTITIDELNERTYFTAKRDFVRTVFEKVNDLKKSRTKTELNTLRDAYIAQGNLADNAGFMFDEYQWRCEELGIGKNAVVDDTQLFHNINAHDKFQAFVFDTAINNTEESRTELEYIILKQARDYAANDEQSEFMYGELASYRTTNSIEMNQLFNQTFNIVNINKLMIPDNIQQQFLNYECNQNDIQRLVDIDNNNIIIFNIVGPENDYTTAINGIVEKMLHDEMIDTHNSVAIVTQEEYTTPDISIITNVPDNIIESYSKMNHVDAIHQIYGLSNSDSKYNKTEYVDKSSNLIDGLDDLSNNLLL